MYTGARAIRQGAVSAQGGGVGERVQVDYEQTLRVP